MNFYKSGEPIADTKAPTGPIADRWTTRKFEAKLVNPANKRKKKIIIMRGKDRIRFNYNDVIKGKNLEQNILLQDGDTIYVP